jgi:predicted porin
MRRTALPLLALGAILLPPASADDLPFSVFGKLDVDGEQVHSSQPGIGGASTRDYLTSNASRVGARGGRDLGGGTQVVWQIASRLNMSGTETGGGGGLFTLWGNSRLGVTGDFGTAFMGVWDTPFRQVYDNVDLFDGSHIASPIALLGSIGNSIGTATTLPTAAQGFPAAVAGATVTTTNFYRRQKSSVQYWTPVYRGLQLKVAYSVDEPDNRSAAANPALWSLAAALDRDPLYVAVAYERHQDMKVMGTVNVPGADSGERLIGAYRLGPVRLALVLEHLSYSTLGAPTVGRTAAGVSGTYQLTETSVAALLYTRAADLSGAPGTGANQVSLRYGRTLGKGTEAYGQYTAIRNGPFGTYNFGDILNIPTGAGARLTGFGIGMAYAF